MGEPMEIASSSASVSSGGRTRKFRSCRSKNESNESAPEVIEGGNADGGVLLTIAPHPTETQAEATNPVVREEMETEPSTDTRKSHKSREPLNDKDTELGDGDESEHSPHHKSSIHRKDVKGKSVDSTPPGNKTKRVKFDAQAKSIDGGEEPKLLRSPIIYETGEGSGSFSRNEPSREALLEAVPLVQKMMDNADRLLFTSLQSKTPRESLVPAALLLYSAFREIGMLIPDEDMLLDADMGSKSRSDGQAEHGYYGDHSDSGSYSGSYEGSYDDDEGSVEDEEARFRRRFPPISNEDESEKRTIAPSPILRYSSPSDLGSEKDEKLQDEKEELSKDGGANSELDTCEVVHLPGSHIIYGTRRHNSDGSIIAYYDDPPRDPNSRQPESTTLSKESITLDKEGRQRLPFVVQINSPLMLDTLEQITQVRWEDSQLVRAPFKIIVLYWKQILSKLEELNSTLSTTKEDFEKTLASNTSDNSAPNPNTIASSSETPKTAAETKVESEGQDQQADDGNDALSTASDDTLIDHINEKEAEVHMLQQDCLHLQTLVDFFREVIGPSLDVQQKVDNGTIETISFENLWQLYQIGDILIYRHDGRETACQVFSVTGGIRGTDMSASMKTDEVLRPHESIVTRMDESKIRDRGVPHYPNSMIRCSPSPYQGFTATNDGATVAGETFTPLIVDCFMMDFNGTYVAPCQLHLQFPYSPGEQPVRSLDAYPMRFHEDGDEILHRLKERGKRLVNSTGHRTYEGWTLNSPDEIWGQIYIDFTTGYKQIGWPGARPEFGRLVRHIIPSPPDRRLADHKNAITDEIALGLMSNRFIDNAKKGLWQFVRPEGSFLSEDCYVLMSYVVLGYAFQMRRWYYLDVDQVGSIDKSERARSSGWEDLVIPPTYREMLVSLVESHVSGSRNAFSRRKRPTLTNQIDLVRGKGNGLIILLHGPPGSGKTSTAETIAAYTQRPLYPITCGDIGATAEEIEFNMQRHFDLANQWGCILLLDEADVFLTKRDWHDINRNSLVSVWLRILEYYSGILFITTNRIGVIDEAFKSRIHVCLRYPSLDISSTKLIWEKLLNKIERDNQDEPVKIVFQRDAILGFAEKHYHKHAQTKSTWNGRQIRNVIQTAISLGQYERLRKLRNKDLTEEDAERSGKEKYMRVELRKENLVKIAATATEFESYMTTVRGSDIKSAKNESMRDDAYGSGGERPKKRYGSLEIPQDGQVMTPPSDYDDGRCGPSSGATNLWSMNSELSYYGCQETTDIKGKGPALDDSDGSF